mmetsp:Transcript_45685/g.110691  ORF Transcript_45685/g.110691 Transcript_45685/m.110691 type:complete len:247 (-) Transcript_45685:591-1331(-)
MYILNVKKECAIQWIIYTFFQEGYLSRTRRGGYVEPLLPPLRHPQFCRDRKSGLLDLTYLVHDFAFMCSAIEEATTTVFFDLGASLQFHDERDPPPALSLVQLYQQFGIKFDHYYAFEKTEIDANRVFDDIPTQLLPSFHWYNVGIESRDSSKRNPWISLLSKFEETDFVVVKLDIDSPAIELSLVDQLLDSNYSRLVDHFYFEHHVKVRNMGHLGWKRTASGTLHDSLQLFTNLRKMGIGAHSWV